MSYTHFTLTERENLQQLLNEGKSFREIAKILGRSPSTISREVKRNYSQKKKQYHPWRATVLYILRRKKCVRRPAIQKDTALFRIIQECFEKYWSPELIAHYCKEQGYSISHATIYKAIRSDLFSGVKAKTHLRRRNKKKYKRTKTCSSIQPEHTIHERPAEANEKNRLGDWEGDTVCGAKNKSCLVTQVDRKSKLLAAAISPNHTMDSVRKATKRAFELLEVSMPIHTMTLDNGSEFAL